MSQQLRAHKIPVDKIEVNPKKMTDIHRKIQAHLASDTQVWSLTTINIFAVIHVFWDIMILVERITLKIFVKKRNGYYPAAFPAKGL